MLTVTLAYEIGDASAKERVVQRALAQLSKVTNVTIARIESGVYDPRLSTLRRLAKALQVKVADLIDE